MRENIHQYFMNIAKVVASRSTCIKRKVGTLIVKDKKIIATGYNNPSIGLENCNPQNCMLNGLGKCIKCIHSELSALLQTNPEERKNAIMYVTTEPCFNCRLAILNSGINLVIYDESHTPEIDWFKNTHVTCKSLKEILERN